MVTHDHDEAYTVADRLAVMRAGRVVQQGGIAEVWAAPADPETARFLGYAGVLRGPAATRVLAAGGLPAAAAVAVRRSALSVDRDGALAGEVVSARATPDVVRLVVDVDDVGRVDAVARSERHPGPGERVRLAVDPARLAAIPEAAMRESSLD
jgi:thiamine transport system ATP-binding protein